MRHKPTVESNPALKRVWSIFPALCLALFLIQSGTVGVRAQESSESAPTSTRQPNPLFELLEIDPDNDRDLSISNNAKESSSAVDATPPAAAPTTAEEANIPRAGSTPSTTTTNDAVKDALQNPEVRQQIAEAFKGIQNGEGVIGEELQSLLGDDFSIQELTARYKDFVWITTGIFLIYPLGILLSELFSFYWQFRSREMSPLDRRYARARLWRRLLLAVVIGGFAVLMALSSVQISWWADPLKMISVMVGVTLLGALWVLLSTMIKQLDQLHTLNIIREVRRDQLELRKDLQEIRLSLKSLSQTEAVETHA